MRRFLFVLMLVLGACADRIEAPLVPEGLNIGSNRKVFVATNRIETTPGTFGIQRADHMKLMEVTVSIPPERDIGTISDGKDKPDPSKDFVLADHTRYASMSEFQNELSKDLRQESHREAIVYVHGFNNSFADPSFRLAQLSQDLKIQSTLVAFSWPSRGNALGYQYDTDSAFYSRDLLAQLLTTVKNAGADRIILLAHSLGSALTMETLRTMEIRQPGWISKNLAGVMLISPDVNVDLFREQTAQFKKWPQPFVVFSSRKDKALLLSGRLRGDNRQLGKLEDLSEIADLPVTFIDVSDFNDGQGHFVTGSSESFIRLVNSTAQENTGFVDDRNSATLSILGTSRVIGRAVSVVIHADER